MAALVRVQALFPIMSGSRFQGSKVCCVAYQAQGTQVSKLRDEVSRVLWSMGVYHADDPVTSDGIFRADIALDGEKVSSKQWFVVLMPRAICLARIICSCFWGWHKLFA